METDREKSLLIGSNVVDVDLVIPAVNIAEIPRHANMLCCMNFS